MKCIKEVEVYTAGEAPENEAIMQKVQGSSLQRVLYRGAKVYWAYKILEKILGKPTPVNNRTDYDEPKELFEWVVAIGDDVFTIYEWKGCGVHAGWKGELKEEASIELLDELEDKLSVL